MEIKTGDTVKYLFPDSSNLAKTVFVGIVDYVGDSFVTLRSEQNTVLKVSFKNFHLLEHCEYLKGNLYHVSENYFG
jgi:hypothetical protein